MVLRRRIHYDPTAAAQYNQDSDAEDSEKYSLDLECSQSPSPVMSRKPRKRQIITDSDEETTLPAPSSDILNPVTVERFLQGLARISPSRSKKYGKRNRRVHTDERAPLKFSKVPPQDKTHEEVPIRNDQDGSAEDSSSSSEDSLFDEKPLRKKKAVRPWTTFHPKHGIPIRTPSFNTLNTRKAKGSGNPSRRDVSKSCPDGVHGPPKLNFIPLRQAEQAYQAKFPRKQVNR